MDRIPNQGCVVAADATLRAIWYEADETIVLTEVPGSIVEDGQGNRRSRLEPTDIIIDLRDRFTPQEFQLLYRDWANARARKDASGAWRFFLTYPIMKVNDQRDGLEVDRIFEDEHPAERMRQFRLKGQS